MSLKKNNYKYYMNKPKKSNDCITVIKYPYNEYLPNYNYNKNTTRMGQARGRLWNAGLA